jgi:hypothetical protein
VGVAVGSCAQPGAQLIVVGQGDDLHETPVLDVVLRMPEVVVPCVGVITRSIDKSNYGWLVVLLGVFATALFYGDSMITPAISAGARAEAMTAPGARPAGRRAEPSEAQY